MARKLKSDRLMFIATLLLVCTSVVMVYSASAVLAMERHHQPYLYLFKQTTWVLLGLLLVPIVMRIDYRRYRDPRVIWAGLAIVAVALLAVLLRPEINGARRWLVLGPFGVQPSELAKLVVILFTAALLERRMDRIGEPSYALLPIAVVVAGVVGLILAQPDLGTAVTVLMIAGLMVFAAGIGYSYVAGLVLLSVPALYFLLMTSEYRRRRVTAFLNPWEDPLGGGFQII